MTKNTINNIFTFLLLFLVVIGIFLFNNVGTYSNDDWWTGFFFTKDIVRTFLHSDQGLVISWFTGKFFLNALPTILHIHPQQNLFIPLVKGINFAILIGIFSLFYNAAEKKIPNPIVVLANTLLTIYIIFLFDIHILCQANQHFKYILNLIIGYSVWYVWINEFLNNKFLSGEKVIRDCIFAALLAFAGHLVNIPTCILFTFLLSYQLLKSKNNTSNVLKVIKTSLPMIIIFIVCVVIYLNLPGFTNIRDSRIPESSVILYFINNFAIFTKEFFIHIFSNRYICGVLIPSIIGILGVLIFNRKINEKYILLSSAIFIANLVFQYTLLSCGRTYYDDMSYWFVSGELSATFMFYLIIVCNITFGCLFRLIEKKGYKIIFVTAIFIIINLVYPITVAVDNIKEFYKQELIQRTSIYKLSKIYRYYDLTDDTIYTPAEYYKNINIFIPQRLWDSLNYNFIIVYHVKKDLRNFKFITYKIANEEELFTEEELKNINFKKLYDDNFILQMKKPKYLPYPETCDFGPDFVWIKTFKKKLK